MSRILQLNLLVLLWSLTAILGEYLSMQPAALVFWRTALASGMFLLFCGVKDPQLLQIPRKHLFFTVGAGFLLGIHWLCFFGAVKLSNVSVGLAGFASTSLFTSLLEPLLDKKRPDGRKVGLALLVAVGIILISGAKTEVPNAGIGLGIALIGALLAAIYSILSKRLVDADVPGPTLMLYQIPASCLAAFLAIILLPHFPWEVPQASDWTPLLILAIACTFVAYLWLARLLKHVSAYTVNLAINFEPVYGMLMAAALLHEYESLTLVFYLGSATIVAANLIHARQGERQ